MAVHTEQCGSKSRSGRYVAALRPAVLADLNRRWRLTLNLSDDLFVRRCVCRPLRVVRDVKKLEPLCRLASAHELTQLVLQTAQHTAGNVA